jgi:hypothetical protein
VTSGTYTLDESRSRISLQLHSLYIKHVTCMPTNSFTATESTYTNLNTRVYIFPY